MSKSRPPEPFGLFSVALAALLLIASCCSPGCSKPPPAPEQVYTVRGRIVSLPDPTSPAGGVQVQHERIPGFVNYKGERVGMDSMIMPFVLRDGLSLGDLRPGDPVEFTWEVRWADPMFFRVASIRKLPADTKLDLGPPE
jgi:hypothetical protein